MGVGRDQRVVRAPAQVRALPSRVAELPLSTMLFHVSQVPGLADVVSVACGSGTRCAIRALVVSLGALTGGVMQTRRLR